MDFYLCFTNCWKKQGLFSIISLAVNAVILSYALDIYVNNPNISLLLICGICVILFTVFSLLLVNGNNEKTYAAIVATLLGTFISLFIAYLVLWITSENGLRYEEMQFLTHPYRTGVYGGIIHWVFRSGHGCCDYNVFVNFRVI